MKCGTCCSIPKDIHKDYIKRIPLYPEEVDALIKIAKQRNLPLEVKEDLVFPDVLNQKILVLTYRFILNNSGYCIFHDKDNGCTIHENKPFACQAYPLAIKRIDAFNLEITIDPSCKWIDDNYEVLKTANIETIKEIFSEEYKKAEAFLQKNKKLQLKIRKLEYEEKIRISRQITIDEFNKCLKEWDRLEITTIKE